MSKKAKLIIKGFGQRNGIVQIYHEVEMDLQEASAFMGGNRDLVIIDYLKDIYPGVEIDPKAIGINLIP